MKASVDQQLLLLRLEQLDTAVHAVGAEMRRSALPPNANEMYKRYKSEGVAPLAEAQKALTRSLAVLGKAQLDLDNLANKLELIHLGSRHSEEGESVQRGITKEDRGGRGEAASGPAFCGPSRRRCRT